jgi:MoxR-like ATPase
MATTTKTNKPSCFTCPSRLSSSKQVEVLGKSTGADVCGLKLIALGRPALEDDQIKAIQINKASNCSSHGQPLAIDPAARNKAIAIDVAVSASFEEPVAQATVSSCASCSHYMPAREVRKRFGWSVGMCTAKGQLVMDDRLSMYARGCEKRSMIEMGEGGTEYWDKKVKLLALFPELQIGWGKRDPLKTLAAFAAKNSNPFGYVSDKPVSPKAIEQGVRAWRRVQDPDGEGPDVFLPIFDHNKYDASELKKVPQESDAERPSEYVDYLGGVYQVTVLWTRLGMTPALWGMPGTGKTEFFRHMAYLMALPFERISVTNSTELEYLEGKMHYSPEKGTYFQYGRVPTSWAKPNVLCLDEPNTGQPAVWQFLRPLTDNSRQLVLDANRGEAINAHVGCYLGFAMNPAWDPRNVGTMELGAADGSRLMHIEMTLPPEEVEKGIILRALAHDRWDDKEAKDTVDTVYRITKDLRAMSDEGRISATFGTRDSIKYARGVRYFGYHKAMRIAMSNAFDPHMAAEVMDVVNRFVES